MPAWSPEAESWSLLGALLASWYRQNGETHDDDVVAHTLDARSLGDATTALGHVTGSASLDQWNDQSGRSVTEVIDALSRAIELV